MRNFRGIPFQVPCEIWSPYKGEVVCFLHINGLGETTLSRFRGSFHPAVTRSKGDFACISEYRRRVAPLGDALVARQIPFSTSHNKLSWFELIIPQCIKHSDRLQQTNLRPGNKISGLRYLAETTVKQKKSKLRAISQCVACLQKHSRLELPSRDQDLAGNEKFHAR